MASVHGVNKVGSIKSWGIFNSFPLQRMCQPIAATQLELANEMVHGGVTNSKHVVLFV